MSDRLVTFENAHGEGEFRISQNHARYGEPESGLYMRSTDKYAAQNVNDIPEMIETLQAIYDDFEANKPKPTIRDFVTDLPYGSIIRFNNETLTWAKAVDGKWKTVNGGVLDYLLDSTASDWNPTVIFNPKEAN